MYKASLMRDDSRWLINDARMLAGVKNNSPACWLFLFPFDSIVSRGDSTNYVDSYSTLSFASKQIFFGKSFIACTPAFLIIMEMWKSFQGIKK